ncbi:Uncharacterised protein [Pantoea agglomerans]|uniref:Uncharacterized protein n=1 Tax=Enterobacter agglomerans TaxID=549 RepID=A0A379AL91_ENTAG|nr:Uncharacterised protein [Pantoea agglomerans]
MRSDSVSSERLSIQLECGSSCVPIALRRAAHFRHQRFTAHRRACNQVRVTANILGQRVERQVSAQR